MMDTFARAGALGLLVTLLGTAACSGSDASFGADPSGGSAGDDAGGGAPGHDGGGGTTDGGIAGPAVAIHVLGSLAPVANADGFASQTPSLERVAITSLRLYRDASDKDGILVFDLGASPVEASLADEADTLVATVPAASLPAGTFTVARVGVSYVRYRVEATVHSTATVAGRLETVQALSAGAMIDGSPRAKGYYQSTFTAGGSTFGPTTGTNPVPKIETSGGMQLDDSGNDAAYVFPVEVIVDPTVTHDVRADLTVDVDHDFRWQDVNDVGYQTGVFDTTTTTFEPVMSFGASAFDLVVH